MVSKNNTISLISH
uniref:Uncharacterized protein n=1 Tax=Anguilla anguilla TaxID=7936 RepID=A0A0E9PSW0_ANGAN